MPDAHKNFAYSVVAVAPTPPDSGTSLAVASIVPFPAPPFNATIWPVGVQPTLTNAEIVRVTIAVGNVITITRAQEGTTARTIIAGDQIAATVTVKTMTDIELSLPVAFSGDPNGGLDGNSARIAYDSSAGRMWIKTTAAGTLTGWI